MFKITKRVKMFLCIVAVMLLIQGIAPVAYATAGRQVSGERVIEVDFSEEQQMLKLTEGKKYLISCQVDDEGWQIKEVSYCIEEWTWILLDEENENDYISVERCGTSEEGKVQAIVKCKNDEVIGLKLCLENAITGQKKDYTFLLTVVKPEPVIDEQFYIWEPSNNDGKIVIDTTGWSFDSITAVYDGTEYTVEVTGLPDYVIPVYTDNTRTNAGTSNAHVSFLVPEGYAVPEDMEATITIERAPLYVVTDKNIVETQDGRLKFVIPDEELPEGVKYSYVVNGVEAESDYVIAHTGMYFIKTEFELTDEFTEEMRQNYITDPSSVIYNVLEHEDVTPSTYGLNFVLKLNQEESTNANEVRVTVSIEFDNQMGRSSTITYVPVYDKDVLTYTDSILPEGMGGGKISSAGIVPAYNYNGGLLNNGQLTTLVFSVSEGADTTNLPFMITDVLGVWIGPDPSIVDKYSAYSTAIVLNPDVDADQQFTVRLPYPAGAKPATMEDDSMETQLFVEDEEAKMQSDEAEKVAEPMKAEKDNDGEETTSEVRSEVILEEKQEMPEQVTTATLVLEQGANIEEQSIATTSAKEE